MSLGRRLVSASALSELHDNRFRMSALRTFNCHAVRIVQVLPANLATEYQHRSVQSDSAFAPTRLARQTHKIAGTIAKPERYAHRYFLYESRELGVVSAP